MSSKWFYFEKEATNEVHLGWEHGKYFDFWSIGHIVSGLILGIVWLLSGGTILWGLVVTAILATFYEFLEMKVRIIEDPQNAVSDIILVIFGYVLALVIVLETSMFSSLLVLGGAIVANIFIGVTGWRQYLKRKLTMKHTSQD